jgi:hypothetical protein
MKHGHRSREVLGGMTLKAIKREGAMPASSVDAERAAALPEILNATADQPGEMV